MVEKSGWLKKQGHKIKVLALIQDIIRVTAATELEETMVCSTG
jgi:hypothetical protein